MYPSPNPFHLDITAKTIEFCNPLCFEQIKVQSQSAKVISLKHPCLSKNGKKPKPNYREKLFFILYVKNTKPFNAHFLISVPI